MSFYEMTKNRAITLFSFVIELRGIFFVAVTLLRGTWLLCLSNQSND